MRVVDELKSACSRAAAQARRHWLPLVALGAALCLALGSYLVFRPRHWDKQFKSDYVEQVGFALMMSGAGEYAAPLAQCMADEMERHIPQERLEALARPGNEPTAAELELGKRVVDYCVCEKVKPPAAFEPGARCKPGE